MHRPKDKLHTPRPQSHCTCLFSQKIEARRLKALNAQAFEKYERLQQDKTWAQWFQLDSYRKILAWVAHLETTPRRGLMPAVPQEWIARLEELLDWCSQGTQHPMQVHIGHRIKQLLLEEEKRVPSYAWYGSRSYIPRHEATF